MLSLIQKIRSIFISKKKYFNINKTSDFDEVKTKKIFAIVKELVFPLVNKLDIVYRESLRFVSPNIINNEYRRHLEFVKQKGGKLKVQWGINLINILEINISSAKLITHKSFVSSKINIFASILEERSLKEKERLFIYPYFEEKDLFTGAICT